MDDIITKLARYADKVTVTEEFKEGKLEAKEVTRIGPDLNFNRLRINALNLDYRKTLLVDPGCIMILKEVDLPEISVLSKARRH